MARRQGIATTGPRGRVVAVTGAARGIGLATAQALSAAGARVAIGDLDGDLAVDAATRLPGPSHGSALDVTQPDSFAAWIDSVEAHLGPIGALVNNAGIMPIGLFESEPEATARLQIEVNVHGVLEGMRLVLPGMLERGEGHIVNIASVAGRAGFPGAATYCGTKHFVMGVSEALRTELRGTGVAVSCILPGHVRTELTSGLRESRWAPPVEPSDIADAIVRVLRRPRFEVYVPRHVGAQLRVAVLVPRPIREALARFAGADKFFVEYDGEARAAYADRSSRAPVP